MAAGPGATAPAEADFWLPDYPVAHTGADEMPEYCQEVP